MIKIDETRITLPTIHVDNFNMLTEDEVWALDDTPKKLVMSDRTVTTLVRPLMLSWYYWSLHRKYGVTPSSKCMMNSVFNSKVHINTLTETLREVDDAHGNQLNLFELAHHQYLTTNLIYNSLPDRTAEYISTISLIDIAEVVAHPDIVEALANVKPTADSIQICYDLITAVLKGNSLRHNNLGRFMRAQVITAGNILQLIALRGFVADINSRIFPIPVMRPYGDNLQSVYNILVESCSAGRALLYQSTPLQTAEYFNRRMQLMCTVFESVYIGDCKTPYLTDAEITHSNFVCYLGKYYVNDNGELEIIREVHRDKLVRQGQIKYRSVMNCISNDTTQCCSTCYGELHRSLAPKTRVGHNSTVCVDKDLASKCLSVKHEDGSATYEVFVAFGAAAHYLRSKKDDTKIYLNEYLDTEKTTLVIPAWSATFSDIELVDDVMDLSVSKLAHLTKVSFIDEYGDKAEVPVCVNNGSSIVTLQFVKYLKQHGWEISPTGDFIIDLSKWDKKDPLFNVPMRNANMLDFLRLFSSIVESRGKRAKQAGLLNLDKITDVSEAISSINNLLLTKNLVNNIVHLEVVLKCFTAEDDKAGNFAPQRGGNVLKARTFVKLLWNRSLMGGLAFQSQAVNIRKPSAYLNCNRIYHPNDEINQTGKPK